MSVSVEGSGGSEDRLLLLQCRCVSVSGSGGSEDRLLLLQCRSVSVSGSGGSDVSPNKDRSSTIPGIQVRMRFSAMSIVCWMYGMYIGIIFL